MRLRVVVSYGMGIRFETLVIPAKAGIQFVGGAIPMVCGVAASLARFDNAARNREDGLFSGQWVAPTCFARSAALLSGRTKGPWTYKTGPRTARFRLSTFDFRLGFSMTREEQRLEESRQRKLHWKRWGPYLSERQWGTVREDYSEYGTAWDYFPHDHARSRAYRWGEDGIAGICDRHQYICFALALWNGRDPILKERLFGLTGEEGNHGEDVKEYYAYLDSTPTHSYMKYLYRYPQAGIPLRLAGGGEQTKRQERFEFELVDTGIFERESLF
jgi:hypothetical protein